MNSLLSAALGVAVVVGVGSIAWFQAGQSAYPGGGTNVSVQTGEDAQATSTRDAQSGEAPTYTAAEVAAHGTPSSCWTSIDGSVYDLTAWIAQHPGGPEAILSLCGGDGTAAFRGQHGIAQRQADILASFRIGALVQ